MGLLDDAKDKARDAASQGGELAEGAIDKGAELADKVTGGRATDAIDKGAGLAKDALGKVTGSDRGNGTQ